MNILQIPRSNFSKSWLYQAAAGWIKLIRDSRGMATTAKDWIKHFQNYSFPMETEKFNFMISFFNFHPTWLREFLWCKICSSVCFMLEWLLIFHYSPLFALHQLEHHHRWMLENGKKSMTSEAELLSRVENNVFWFLMLIFPRSFYASHLALMYSHFFCCMVENRTQKKVWFTSTFIINHTKTYLWWTGERLN